MAYENEARRAQQLLRSAASDTRNQRNQVNSLVDQRPQYWKGKGADAFSKEFQEINSDVDKLLRCIDRAGDALGQLPSQIARAEQERKQKAAKKK